MSIKRNFLFSCLVTGLALLSLQATANNIDADIARNAANNFLKQQAATTKSFKSVSQADLKLAYAEKSSVVANAKAYYAFNINGGGFVIIAGEDRANQVLGYSDHGSIDFNNLPENFKALMNSYKEEIEYLQAHPSLNVTPKLRASNGTGVAPMIKAIWGQEMPYYLQCPMYQGEYCVVGCVATAMTQVMYYWKYPTSSPVLNSYYCSEIGQTIPSLPETTFNYNLMLTSYCHWDWEQSALIQDTYTDEQAQAVAKLARYCGQAVHMSYSPEGSGAYTSSQLTAMKKFGYSSSAKDVTRSSWWSDNYTTEQWENMIKAELDARCPILYSANDYAAGGHAFVCDGYDNTGMFHFNFGWYGTCDGWYTSTALNMTHRDGDVLHFNYDHEMLTGVVPPTYCIITTDGINAEGDLFVLGEGMPVEANNVEITTSNAALNFLFSINNASGKMVASSPAINITTANYTQGNTLGNIITLPATMEQGTYNIRFNYYVSNPRILTKIDCEEVQLHVIGNLAKYNAPFSISDVTLCIDYLLEGTRPRLTIDDVTMLIDALLSSD